METLLEILKQPRVVLALLILFLLYILYRTSAKVSKHGRLVREDFMKTRVRKKARKKAKRSKRKKKPNRRKKHTKKRKQRR